MISILKNKFYFDTVVYVKVIIFFVALYSRSKFQSLHNNLIFNLIIVEQNTTWIYIKILFIVKKDSHTINTIFTTQTYTILCIRDEVETSYASNLTFTWECLVKIINSHTVSEVHLITQIKSLTNKKADDQKAMLLETEGTKGVEKHLRDCSPSNPD